MKKAQGLPINTIIIAVLVMIVLVVMILIFTGKISLWGKSFESCATYGGGTDKCKTVDEGFECTTGSTVKCNSGGFCCVGVETTSGAEE